jgi:hypothetical protein
MFVVRIAAVMVSPAATANAATASVMGRSSAAPLTECSVNQPVSAANRISSVVVRRAAVLASAWVEARPAVRTMEAKFARTLAVIWPIRSAARRRITAVAASREAIAAPGPVVAV